MRRRVRRSTVALCVIFAAALLTYILVRPVTAKGNAVKASTPTVARGPGTKWVVDYGNYNNTTGGHIMLRTIAPK